MITFNIFGYFIIAVFSIACVIPFWITVIGSFTAEKYLFMGLSFWPAEFSLESYKVIFSDYKDIVRAYGITIFTLVIGTPLSLWLVSMAAFVLQHHDFRYKNVFSLYFFFTTLFSGGLVPYYILITNLRLRDNILVLIVPGLVNIFNIIITRTYFKNNIPGTISEAARIDGAGNFIIYCRIYLPLAIPMLATIGLFTAIGFWNQWYAALLFITERRLYPLQYLLYRMFQSAAFAQLVAEKAGKSTKTMPLEGFKLAMTVITTGPIIIAYPFAQKYFVSGLTIGAVKG
jgi:putative aldouronate transport system permease protein